ncbi:MAG: hypothetical protein Q8P18_15595 [Pseudomonadota bacterium]|nr:hypothetical protein [Pseudomonadota bacterium]
MTALCAATLLVVTQATATVPADVAGPAAVTLSAASVPATGAQNVQVQVTRFGRYALSAKSAQGSAVQLVDRMAGPGEVSRPGANGRVDAFLERGEYRLKVLSDLAGTGDARIEARPFVEVNTATRDGRPPLLPDLATVATTLTDLQQRSWWLDIEADQAFAVELAGRSLADVRLWRDGQWLDPAAPSCEDISPDSKRPLRRCELNAKLAAGLWQLVAYGGPAVPWSVPDGDQPLHVRRGLASLPVASRLMGAVGPFGAERWLVPGQATTYRLELPSGADARLAVRAFDAADPFRRDGTGAGIQKETMPPLAEVGVSSTGDGRVVTVTGAVGQPFVLQHFPQVGRSIPVKGRGAYFLTTLHAGDPGDLPDVTGVLVETRKDAKTPPPAPLATSLLPLGPDAPYRRQFNLLGTTSLSFEVAAEGEYHVALSAAGVGWRWEPLLTSTASGYEAPPFREGPAATALTPGRWTLTLSPTKPGIAEVVIRRDAKVKAPPNAPRANVQFPMITLDPTKSYVLTLNEVPGAKVGMVLRALPADLAQALPITLGPGESVTVPTAPGPAGTLDAGKGFEVAVDGGAWAPSANVGTGGHIVLVRNPGKTVLQGAVALLPDDRRPDARLPELPETIDATPPDLPLLTAAAPRALDLGVNDTATYGLRVDKAGLYRTESTGLLATAGAVRTRTTPVLASAAVNGTGRNFQLQRYLREGDYQVTVATQGASAGHLGLRLVPTALRDGGALRDGVPARATVPAGEGIAYQYDVPEAGEYVLRSFGQGSEGQGRLFRVRVEDADGWPLLSPDVDGDLRLDLPKGKGRILVLPEPVETTRITTFERVPPPVVRFGHGPHALGLDAAATHVWWEPSGKEDRVPDQWAFALRAPADVTITADAEMTGDLLREGTSVARLVPGRVWTGRLDAGAYRLDLVNARRNSGVTYTVRVSPRELVAGLSRVVTAPAALPVSVGADGLVELTSMGVADVRARLYDADGRLVATADDRPDDWNFRIAERLAPGAYTLQVDPVGADSGRTTVTLALAAESDALPLPVGQARTLTLGLGVSRIPIEAPPEGLLVVSARSEENVGLAVEARDEASADGAWRTVGRAMGPSPRVVVRLGALPAAEPGRRYRLRLESLDGRRVPTMLRADVVTPKRISEGALANGASVPIDKAAGIAAAIVTRDRAGLLELATRVGLDWCPAVGEACERVPGAVLAGGGGDVWLVGESIGGRAVALRGVRHVLGSAPVRASFRTGTRLFGASVDIDLAPSAGPVFLTARTETGQPRFGGQIDVGPKVAATVLFGDPSVSVYVDDAVGGTPVDVALARAAFPVPTPGAFVAGAAGGTLAPGAAWRGALPASPGVRFVLAEGLVAVLSTGLPAGDQPVDVFWASDGPRDVTTTPRGATLTVLNPTGAPAVWLAVTTTYVRAPGAGRTRINLPGKPGATLHVRGDVRDVVGVNNGVVTGFDVPLGGAPGWVEVVQASDVWTLWTDQVAGSEGDAGAMWGGSLPIFGGAGGGGGAGAGTAVPASVPVSRAGAALRIASPGPGLLTVRVDQPVIAYVREGGGPARGHFVFDGALDVPVGADVKTVDVALRTLDAGPSKGEARIDYAPATPLAEGIGPEVLLGAGMSRAFSVTVDRAGPIGVGVRVTGADAEVALYTASGSAVAGSRLVAAGVAMMPTLQPGTYLLTATLPADAAPARIRPALVGLTPPDTGPPDEVIRAYLVAAGLIPPAPADPEEDSQ